MKKKPKIAVYICGQWRGSSYKCSEYLNKTFNEYNCDFFIHTFNFYQGKAINTYELPIHGVNDLDSYYHTESDINEIKKSYPNVVYFEVDTKEKNYEIDYQFQSIVNISSFNQFYCSYKCNEYRKIYENFNGFRYDIIIKIRPDIIFTEDSGNIIKMYIESIMSNNRIMYSKYHQNLDVILSQPPRNLVWDHWTFSSPFGMDCMMEWVSDILNGKQTYLSDYVIKHNLDPNPNIFNTVPPNSYIIRELFKFFDLKYFYEKKYTYPWDHFYKKNLINSVNSIFYMSGVDENELKLFLETYDFYAKMKEILNIKNIESKPIDFNIFNLDHGQLEELANYLKTKQLEYEEKLNNL